MIEAISTSSLKMVTAVVVAAPLTLAAPAIAMTVTPADASLNHHAHYSYNGASWLGVTAAELATRSDDAIAELVALLEPHQKQVVISNLIGSSAVGSPISLRSKDVTRWLDVHSKYSSSQRIADQEERFQKAYAELHEVIPEADKDLLADAANFYDAIQSLAWKPSIWCDEGEVAFEWKTADKHAIVSFDGESTYGYAMLMDGKFRPGAIDMPAPNTVPSDLLAYLDVA